MRIEDIGKRMPFGEDEGYVEQLLERAAKRALNHRNPHKQRLPLRRIVAMVTVLLAIGGMGWFLLGNPKSNQAPLDTFLESVTEEELVMLEDYCDEEMLASEWEWEALDVYTN